MRSLEAVTGKKGMERISLLLSLSSCEGSLQVKRAPVDRTHSPVDRKAADGGATGAHASY